MLKYFLNPKKDFYMLKFVLGIFNFQLLYGTSKFFFSLNNNFSNIQPFFVLFFFLKKILSSITMILTFFLFFYFRKIFISLPSLFSSFFFFLFRKIFISFTCFFLNRFFLFFDNICLLFLYMYTKKYKFFFNSY